MAYVYLNNEITMPYVLKNSSDEIIAVSDTVQPSSDWLEVDIHNKQYLNYLEQHLAKDTPFRESDIQLARVLEDLINLLIEKETIRFTDLPEPAQKRLLERQSLRKKNKLLNIVDDNRDYFY